jgi:hypothetical protein
MVKQYMPRNPAVMQAERHDTMFDEIWRGKSVFHLGFLERERGRLGGIRTVGEYSEV